LRFKTAHLSTPNIRVSSGARKSFVDHHGGENPDAYAELNWMLQVFAEHATHQRDSNGSWSLDFSGYRLKLRGDGSIVTGYSTTHSELSFAQHVAKVPSRKGAVERAERRSDRTPRPTSEPVPFSRPEDRTAIEKHLRDLMASGLHVTAEACAAFERLDRRGLAFFDEDFHTALNQALDADTANAPVISLDGSELAVRGAELTWRIDIARHILVDIERTEDRALEEESHNEPATVELSPAEPSTPKRTIRFAGQERFEETVTARAMKARTDPDWTRLQGKLHRDLLKSGARVGTSTCPDLWSRSGGTLVLYQVVGGNRSDYPRIRSNALHLLEAAALQQSRPDDLVIAVGQRPEEPWAADALKAVLGIKLTWPESGRWAGPGAEHIPRE
jgi:hypothetical protein